MFFKIPYISYFYSIIATLLSVILFVYSSFFEQTNQILSLRLPVSVSIRAFLELAGEGVVAMDFWPGLLLVIWVAALFIFYSTLFGLVEVKRKFQPAELRLKKSKHTIVGGVSFILSWMSFGCVACGQAILTSIVAIFVTQVSVGLMHNVVFFVLMISIIMLLITSYRNYQLLKNPNICPV
jgi:hypothetical protein